MKVIPGHEDLKPRPVIGLKESGGKVLLLVPSGGEDPIASYELWLGPSGNLMGKPYAEPNPDNTPDQVGIRKTVPVAQRWAGVDQT